MDIRLKTGLMILAMVCSLPAMAANTWFIEAGTIYTGNDRVIENGIIRIEGKTITYVGRRLTPPPDALVLEARDKFITPGFIVANTHIGVPGETSQPDDPVREITPGFRAYDILDPDHPGFREAVEYGVTCLNVMLQSPRAMPGVGVLVKAAGSGLQARVLRPVSALSINLVQQQDEGSQGSREMSTRDFSSEVAAIIEIRNSLNRAKNLRDSVRGSAGQHPGPGHMQILIRVLNQEIPAFITADTPTEIERGYSLYEDYQLRPVFVRMGSIEEVWERFGDARMPIITGPVSDPGLSTGSFSIPLDRIGRLFARGFRVHLQPAANGTPVTGGLRTLQYQTALLQKLGFTWQEALSTITSIPAELLGVGDRNR